MSTPPPEHPSAEHRASAEPPPPPVAPVVPAMPVTPPPGRAQRPHDAPLTPTMIALRYLLPTAVVIGGLIVMAFGSETDLEGGAGILSAGLAIYFINWLYRAGVAGDRQREAEDRARDYYDRHGRWPN
jgi:hypothetical protein